MKRLIFILILLSSVTCVASFANNVSEYTLKNGLKLVVKVDHRAPVVISEVWYRTGSGYEHSGITGVSHVLEHMMFKGTKDYGPGEFSKIIADNGGQENAATSYDYTYYYQKLENTKLPISFKLEADRMRNLLLRPEDFRNELHVVMEERRLRTEDNPQALTYERFQAAAFINNPYHHPVIGWMNDLLHMDVADVLKWYQTWYAPNNAIVVVVGDINPESVYQLAQKYFGPLKPSPIPKVKPRQELSSLGLRSITVKLPAKLPWLLMGYNVPSLPTAKQKWQPYALRVLAFILDGSDSARIPTELIRGKQLAVGAGVNYDIYRRNHDLLILAGTPSPGTSLQDLQKALLAQIKQLQQHLVTAKELSRIKALVIANKIYNKDSIAYQAAEIGRLEAVGLSWKVADEYVSKIEAVTPQQIQQVARQYLTLDNLTIATLQPLPLHQEKTASLKNQGGLFHVF